MPAGLKNGVEFDHTLKLALQVTPIEELERAPALLGAKEMLGLEEHILYHAVVPMEERLRAALRCYGILGGTRKVESSTWAKAGFRVYGSWRVAVVGPARLCLGEPWIGGL
jgi:hypothetical protein